MATVASIVTNLRANTGQFDKALDGAAKRTRDFKKHAEDSFLGGIHSAAGSKSFIGETAHLLEGRGPIAGLTLLSGAFSEAAKSAAEMRKQLANGEITLTQYKSRMIELIPVIGSFAKQGREMGEAFRDAAKSMNEFKTESIIKDIAGRGKETGDAMKKVFDDAAASNKAAMEPRQKALLEERERHRANMDAIKAERAAMENNRGNAYENVWKNMNEFGSDSPQFRDAMATAKAAKDRQDAYELVAKNLSQKENETHSANRQRINQGPSPWLSVIQGTDDAIKGIKGYLVELSKIPGRVGKVIEVEDKARIGRRAAFTAGARGIYERLKDQQNDPVQFTPAMQVGTQQEFAARQAALVAPFMNKQSDTKLLEEAVKLQQKEIDETKEIAEAIAALGNKLGIVDFQN